MPASSSHTLAAFPLFRDMPPAAREGVERRCVWKRHPAKDVIVHYEDETRDVSFLVSGRARVIIYSSSGRAVAFRDATAGDLFGEFSAIDGAPRSASVEAVEPCLVGHLEAGHFNDILKAHPDVTLALLRRSVAQIRAMTKRVFEFSTLAVSNRIHAELLRLARDGRVVAGKRIIAPFPKHADIASRLSTHREAVTRELSRLEDQSVITRPATHEVLCDIAALERLVDEGADH
jgi:CRP/FNR family transcriptional regulator, cyclic AMP receptor protein